MFHSFIVLLVFGLSIDFVCFRICVCVCVVTFVHRMSNIYWSSSSSSSSFRLYPVFSCYYHFLINFFSLFLTGSVFYGFLELCVWYVSRLMNCYYCLMRRKQKLHSQHYPHVFWNYCFDDSNVAGYNFIGDHHHHHTPHTHT